MDVTVTGDQVRAALDVLGIDTELKAIREVRIGVRDSSRTSGELKLHLTPHVTRACPPHQLVDLPWRFRLIFQYPTASAGSAGLHGTPRRLIDTREHVTLESPRRRGP